jgi:regulator of ribonuclease activity A
VDGGGSLRCALLGSQLATLPQTNGWTGVVLNGCIRDCSATGVGQRNLPLQFAGVTLRPGSYLYADEDGLIVAERDLLKR